MEKLCGQTGLCLWSLGGQDEAGCVFIDAVYQTGFGTVRIVAWIVLQMPGQSIDQCTGIVTTSRMNYHAWCFINQNHIAVLISHFNREVLRYDFILIFRTTHDNRCTFTRLNPVTAFYRTSVYAQTIGFGCGLNSGTRNSSQMFHQKFVYTHQRLSGWCRSSIMFVKQTVIFVCIFIVPIIEVCLNVGCFYFISNNVVFEGIISVSAVCICSFFVLFHFFLVLPTGNEFRI